MSTAQDLASLVEQPFELLREIERRSRVAVAGKGAGDSADEWVGIGFRIGQENFVAARDQVREVLMLPESMTRVPGAKRWLLGIANLRGHLLPLIDLNVRFRVDGLGTFSSVDQPTVALPPEGSQRMRFTAALPTGGADPHGRPFSFSATMTYQPPGELRQIFSESGVPRPFVIASADGTLGEPLE